MGPKHDGAFVDWVLLDFDFWYFLFFFLFLWFKYKYPDQAKREVVNAIQQFTDLRPVLNTHGETVLFVVIIH